MPVPNRTLTLTTPEAVDAFLADNTRAVLLKLGTCRKNDVALEEVERQLAGCAEVPLGLLHVVDARPASNHVAGRTGIVHESPQLIVFVDGRPVFERNNWGISPSAVREAVSLLDEAKEGRDLAALAAAPASR